MWRKYEGIWGKYERISPAIYTQWLGRILSSLSPELPSGLWDIEEFQTLPLYIANFGLSFTFQTVSSVQTLEVGKISSLPSLCGKYQKLWRIWNMWKIWRKTPYYIDSGTWKNPCSTLYLGSGTGKIPVSPPFSNAAFFEAPSVAGEPERMSKDSVE